MLFSVLIFGRNLDISLSIFTTYMQNNKNINQLYPIQPSETLDIQLKIKMSNFMVHNIAGNEKLLIIYG